jgi:hypothetical protein
VIRPALLGYSLIQISQTAMLIWTFGINVDINLAKQELSRYKKQVYTVGSPTFSSPLTRGANVRGGVQEHAKEKSGIEAAFSLIHGWSQ